MAKYLLCCVASRRFRLPSTMEGVSCAPKSAIAWITSIFSLLVYRTYRKISRWYENHPGCTQLRTSRIHSLLLTIVEIHHTMWILYHIRTIHHHSLQSKRLLKRIVESLDRRSQYFYQSKHHLQPKQLLDIEEMIRRKKLCQIVRSRHNDFR